MFVKILLKIVFKATMPLIMMVGMTSYVIHLKGGDPLAIASRVTGGMFDSMSASANSAKYAAQQSLSKVSAVTSGTTTTTTVYKWIDASGTPHFGSTPPPDVDATPMIVRNTSTTFRDMQSQPTPAPADAGYAQSGGQIPVQPDGQPMPGMAGVAGQIQLPEGIDPNEVLKMLTQAQGVPAARPMPQ